MKNLKQMKSIGQRLKERADKYNSRHGISLPREVNKILDECRKCAKYGYKEHTSYHSYNEDIELIKTNLMRPELELTVSVKDYMSVCYKYEITIEW